MAKVNITDKRSGLTYVYESHSYRDKESGKVRSKRRLIGRLDPVTGEVVATDGRGRNRDATMPRTLKECREEIRRLRAENAELRSRLGFEEESSGN